MLPLAGLALCSLALAPAATADEPLLSLAAGADLLGASGAEGGAVALSLRYQPVRHFAANLDLGYGLLAAGPGLDDRWWLMPGAAAVFDLGPSTLDLGGGAGVGTVSGYASWPAYLAAPFGPIWHTSAPAVGLHVALAAPVTRGLALFARADIAALLPDVTGTLWGGLWLGLQFRLL